MTGYARRNGNDCAIVDPQEAMSYVMIQTNATFLVNQNRNGGTNGLCGLGKFQKNNPLMFKGRYDYDGTHAWIQEIQKISRVMACIDAQKVLFRPHMLSREVEHWWENTRQRLEVVGISIN